MSILRRIPAWLLIGTIAALPAVAGAATYKWVDEKGVTHYGDRIPPQYAKQQREVLNQRGDTVKVLEHEKTAEELAEEARQKELAEEEKEQARQDSFLLSTYSNEADLQKTRDEQLANLDGNIRISEMALQNTEKDLVTRKQREADLTKAGKPVPPDLAKQIEKLQVRVERDSKTLAKRRQEREAIAAKWERNIVRWRQLKAASSGQSAAN